MHGYVRMVDGSNIEITDFADTSIDDMTLALTNDVPTIMFSLADSNKKVLVNKTHVVSITFEDVPTKE